MVKYLVANWKMDLKRRDSLILAEEYAVRLKPRNVQIIVAPAALYLEDLKVIFKKSDLRTAAQDVSSYEEGDFTGELSAGMMKELGCEYAIVGHSERRRFMNESDEMINLKLGQCYKQGISPIFCVGENLQERKENKIDAILTHQLRHCIEKTIIPKGHELIIAYEPVWAVGTGIHMEPGEMQLVHRIIKKVISSLISETFYNRSVKLLYGGSISVKNAGLFVESNHLDGLLVGGESLDIDKFSQIVKIFENKIK